VKSTDVHDVKLDSAILISVFSIESKIFGPAVCFWHTSRD